MVEIKQLAVIVKKEKKNSSSLLKLKVLICLVTIVLIKAITHHSKLSQTPIFHCGSSRRFCMKGVHLNRLAMMFNESSYLVIFLPLHKSG